jgi:hypothetical protein
MENLDEVKDIVDGAKRAPKRTTTPKPAVTPEPEQAEAPPIPEDVNANKGDENPKPFPGCSTCYNFGSYPAWQPCADCCRNPKNQIDFYTP